MKYILITILLFILFPLSTFASEKSLADKMSGKILLQVESYGRAWYVEPTSKQKFYLRDGNEAYKLMKKFALGISNRDLAKIPMNKNQFGNKKLINRLRGRILLQVESHGEAWYVNPNDGIRYYLKNGQAAYKLMKKFALGISNRDLAKIPMNKKQIAYDTCFNDIAYVKYDGKKFSHNYNAKNILPLASLTKLMTALVLLDTNPNWQKEIIITKQDITYPKIFVGNDPTSEINLSIGDRLSFNDLWHAMLISSSNQATAALVRSTGISNENFIVLMNQKAKDINLTKTKFYDPTGLDAHNVSTPEEMSKIAYLAFNKEKIANPSNQGYFIINTHDINGNIKQIKIWDRNYSLKKFKPQSVKTGYLIEAERNVVLKKNNYIITVMHSYSIGQRNQIIKNLIN